MENEELAKKAETCPICMRAREKGGIAQQISRLMYTTIFRRRRDAYEQLHGKPPWECVKNRDL